VLAVPEGDGPFPGAVLVHGAGIHDPDGTAGNSKILADVAEGLASDGIATLRYAKRLHDHDVADEAFTFDRIVTDDAVAAVEELADADAVDAASVFVLGHSQGGMAAPRIADRHGGVGGVVVLDAPADPTVDPGDLAFVRYGMDPDGDLTDDQEAQLEAQHETFRRIATGEYDDDETLLGKPGVWHRTATACDPAGTAAGLDVPTVVAKAGRADAERQPGLLASMREGVEAWRDADLPDGSRVEWYRHVDHYFQAGPTPTTIDGLYFGGNVEADVLADIATWIRDTADA
jgi:pimeloyl-ACP methyl ester carboxylesterase